MAFTPGSSKKPFPPQRGSTYLTELHNNISPTYPLELHHVKALFVSGRYKQCIQKCHVALAPMAVRTNSVTLMFLSFYAAMSHEALARMMHDFSVSKIPAFSAAEDLYIQAIHASTLVWREKPTGRLYRARTNFHDSAIGSDDGHLTHPPPLITQTEDIISQLLSFPVNELDASSSTYSVSRPTTPTNLPPGAPRSCRASFIGFDDDFVFSNGEPQFGAEQRVPQSRNSTLPSSPPTFSPNNEQLTRILRYSAHVTSFRAQLHFHLEQVQTLRDETLALHAARNQKRNQPLLTVEGQATAPTKIQHSRSLWLLNDPKKADADMEERIKQGRERGWARERFDAEKYVNLAEEALAELQGCRSWKLDDH